MLIFSLIWKNNGILEKVENIGKKKVTQKSMIQKCIN